MADSFADLWASSAHAKQTQQSPTLGIPIEQKLISSAQRPHWDAFSALSVSQPTSRVHSPHPTRTQVSIKTAPGSQMQGATDPFSGLLDASSGFGGGATNRASSNMTMAERAALARKKMSQRSQQEGAVVNGPKAPSAWDDLDALSQAGASHTSVVSGPSPEVDFELAFGSAQPDQEDSNVGAVKDVDPSSTCLAQTSPQPKAQTQSPSLWDLDEFASDLPSRPQQSQQSQVGSTIAVSNSPDRDHGDILLEADAQDDILGDLGKPVSHPDSVSPSPPQDTTAATSRARPPSRTQTTSPPPHITGKLVEMGFAPQLARTALVSTTTADGFDVQGALDWLLAHNEARSLEQSDTPGRSRARERGQHAIRGTATRTSDHRNSQAPQTNLDVADFPASAEKLLSQASEIGRGMFNRANTLFKEGKERAMKMYEERSGVNASTRPTSGRDGGTEGKPRWMREGAVEGAIPEDKSPGSFEDDDGEERVPRIRPSKASQQSFLYETQPLVPPSTQEVDLLGVDSPVTVYQSPFRRKPPTSSTPNASSVLTSSSPPPPPSTHPAIPNKLTATIPCDIFVEYSSQKMAGTNAYKLGQYPAAAEAYSRAIRPLPEGHPLRLPLLTNRASAQSKVGGLVDVAEDCSAAILLVEKLVGNIGTGTARMGRLYVQVEGSVQAGLDGGTEVDLAGGLTKAYHRRAEAYEGLEKWAGALADWEVLVSAEWSGPARVLASSGVTRCRKMIGGGDLKPSAPASSGLRPTNIAHQSPKPPAKPRPRTPPRSGQSEDSPAVAALRSAAILSASEDAERLAHKDAVDARLIAWRKGKETNIRALLTTLDVILWPELGWKKVGMAEVVRKGQVKVVYMRAIARLHPDKLNASNTAVEQRMIANGVFGTLNEAWHAFQPQ